MGWFNPEAWQAPAALLDNWKSIAAQPLASVDAIGAVSRNESAASPFQELTRLAKHDQ